MSERFQIIDALVDGEPVDRAALEEALSDRAGRAYLVDAWVLRGLVQDEMARDAAPSPIAARKSSRHAWLVAAALGGVCLIGGYFTGMRFPIGVAPRPAVTAPGAPAAPAVEPGSGSRSYPLPPATRVIRLELDPNWKETSGGR